MQQESSDPGYGSYRFVVGGASWFLQFCMGMSFFSVAPLFQSIMDSYGISRSTVSLLVGVGALIMATLLIPASVIASRLGPRRALALSGVLMAGVGLAPLAFNFPILLATRVSFAVGAAIMLSALPLAVVRWFPTREFPVINGLNVASQSLGVTVSMVATASVADATSWRIALAIIGITTACATLAWLLLARDRGAGIRVAESSAPSLASIRATLSHRTTLLLGMGLLCGIGANVSFNSWLPTYYNEEFGYSLQRAGVVVGVLSVFGIAGALLGSALPVRLGVRRPFLVAAGILLPVAGFGCFIIDSPYILFPAAALFGIGSWIYFPVAFTIPLEVPGLKPENAAMMVATALSIGNLSGFAAPLFVGLIRDATGAFVPGLAVCCLLPIGLLVAGLLLPETGPGRARGRRLPPSAAVSETTP